MKKLGSAILVVMGIIFVIYGFAIFWGAYTNVSIIPNSSSTQGTIIDYFVSFLTGFFGGIIIAALGVILCYIGYIGFNKR
ncbi:MAG: hypothetical protein WC342_01660 [Methanoregula sp.]|jgi:hypothetical protein